MIKILSILRVPNQNAVLIAALVTAVVLTAAGCTGEPGDTSRTPVPEPTPTMVSVETIGLTRDEAVLAQWFAENEGWRTDFNLRAVSLTEFESLLQRDGIIPLDDPQFAAVEDAPDYMRAEEPVISVNINGDARAYPLAMLMWHEIVNDTVGDLPVTVTFCPLCNSAIVFERTVEGQTLTFGTTGKLRNSDLVMWDRQTESWWQQITGEAVVGQFAGTTLEFLSSSIVSWETFSTEYPEGQVLLRERYESGSYVRPYDDPPYDGYDSIDSLPFALMVEPDGRLLPMTRMLTIESNGISVAYPFDALKESPVVNDRVGELDVVIFFDDDVFSPFDSVDGETRQSGSTTVFERTLNGRLLTFEAAQNGIIDIETGSTWTIGGMAVNGPLEGAALKRVVHGNHFWFAWALFRPETEIRRPG